MYWSKISQSVHPYLACTYSIDHCYVVPDGILQCRFCFSPPVVLSQNWMRKPTLVQQSGCLCDRAPRPTALSISLCFQLHQVTQVKKSITWRLRLLRWQSEVFVEAHFAFSVRAVTDEHKKHLFQALHLETLLWSRLILSNIQLQSKIIQWNDIWDLHWGTGAPSWTILH